MTYRQKTFKGFTILELLIAIALVGMAVTIVTLSFSKVNANKALDGSVALVTTKIKEARIKTLSGENASQYGVYLGDTELVLFRGVTYSEADPNNASTTLNSLVGLRNVSLPGGGRTVLFQKFTGATAQSGTFEIFLKEDPTQYKTISITQTGLVEEN